MLGGIAVIDFGSQLTQLIARRLREIGYYTEIFPYNVELERLRAAAPKGIILSGGPNSVYEEGAPQRDIKELRAVAPVLGICYGMQLLSQQYGGIVKSADVREYGFNTVHWKHPFTASIPEKQKVWMSHGDQVVPTGGDFIALASTDTCPVAAARYLQRPIYGLQFHPEVSHTEHGMDLLEAFARDYCKVEAKWSTASITNHLLSLVKEKVGPTSHVVCGLSGGVDSTVVAMLLTKALGAARVHCIFVDNGLLRKNEFISVLDGYKKLGLNIKGVNAADAFLSALKGLEDPEAKRKAIGRVFIQVFEKCRPAGVTVEFLAQGTLYPDVIESVSPRGGSVTIKSHHNVGGLPDKMNLKLVEPLRELFKDEVRAIGAELGLPRELLWRHPFPGPGLAIRILGEVTKESLEIVRECDAIFINALKDHELYHNIWQAFCVLLPCKSVGVQGDGRTYEKVIALRAVTSKDGMTADWFPFEFEFLRTVSNRITNEVKGVNRVVYDVTSKPPGTIEWE
jgi:GMP synthase (glutamine-hydrolysing)